MQQIFLASFCSVGLQLMSSPLRAFGQSMQNGGRHVPDVPRDVLLRTTSLVLVAAGAC